MIHVLYIIGWGRSGSTMLDTSLGAFRGVVSTGELRFLWERGLLEGRLCGCGRPVPECAFWTGVLDRLEERRRARGAAPARPRPEQVVGLREAVARTRHAPGLSTRRGPRIDALRALTGDLAAAVAAEAGAQVVVDSSKMPADAALYVGCSPTVALHLVHLVRDPRAVAYSWQRPKLMTDLPTPVPIAPHPPARSSLYWASWNLLAERLAARAATYRRVRYEDLVAEPAAVLRRILADVGLDADPTDVVTPDGLRVPVSHTVAGNPSRFEQGTVPVRPDDAWRARQPGRQRLLATLPALPLLRRYGYPVRVAGA